MCSKCKCYNSTPRSMSLMPIHTHAAKKMGTRTFYFGKPLPVANQNSSRRIWHRKIHLLSKSKPISTRTAGYTFKTRMTLLLAAYWPLNSNARIMSARTLPATRAVRLVKGVNLPALLHRQLLEIRKPNQHLFCTLCCQINHFLLCKHAHTLAPQLTQMWYKQRKLSHLTTARFLLHRVLLNR